MNRISSQFRRIWDASQPALRKPRLWVAAGLRKCLWRTTFIAITGSNGKSTTTRILAAILSTQGSTQWTRMNRNIHSGWTETIAFCRPWKTRYAVFEVGAGKEGTIAAAMRLIRPHISVVLSVFLEHRYFFKTIEAVAREKSGLISGLKKGGLAVINADDPRVAVMSVPPGCSVIRFGSSPDNDVYCENPVSASPQLLRFTAVVRGQRQEIRTRLLGTHWTGPIMACLAVADSLGIPLEQSARAIANTTPYPARMQVVNLPSGAVVIRDEFKASKHTVDAAFDELRKAQASRKLLAFCDVAETSAKPRKRLRRVGREAAEFVDYAIFIGDGAHYGVQGARQGGLGEGQALAFPDYQAAAEFLRPLLGQGDLLLLKASRNNQLPRLFYSLLGEVRCTIPKCDKPMVCDDCILFRNPELVHLANMKLTATAD